MGEDVLGGGSDVVGGGIGAVVAEETRAKAAEATKLDKAANLSDLASAILARANISAPSIAALTAETARAEAAEALKAAKSEKGALGEAGKWLAADDAELKKRLPYIVNVASKIPNGEAEVDGTAALQALVEESAVNTVFDFGGSQFTYWLSTVNLKSGQSFRARGAKINHLKGSTNPIFYHAKATAGTIERVLIEGFRFEGYGWAENTEEKLKCAVYIVHAKDVVVRDCRAKNFLSAAFHVQLAGDVLYDNLIAIDCGTPGGRNAIEILGEEEETESTEMFYDATIRSCKADCAEAFHGGAGGVCIVAKKSQNVRSTMFNNRAYNCMNFAGIDCEAGWTRYTILAMNQAYCCKEGIQNVDTMSTKPGTHVVDRMIICSNITDCKNVTTRTAKNATIEVKAGEDMPKSEGIATNGSHTNLCDNVVRSTAQGIHLYENLASSGETNALASAAVNNRVTIANTDAANKPFGFEFIGCEDLTTTANHLDIEAGALMKDAYLYQDCVGVTEGSNSSREAGRHAIKCTRVKHSTFAGGGMHTNPCATEGESAIELVECEDVHVGGGKKLQDTRGEHKMKVGLDIIASSTLVTVGELPVTGYTTAPVRGIFTPAMYGGSVPYVLPPLTSARYYGSPGSSNTTSSGQGNKTVKYSPFLVTREATFDRIACIITVVGEASSLVRLGIREDDGTGKPGKLVVDAGTVAGNVLSSTTERFKEIEVTLKPGLYWLAACVQEATVTQPTLQVNAVQSGLVQIGVANATVSVNAGDPMGWSEAEVAGAFAEGVGTLGATITATRVLLRKK
jgi:hypothetical protein